MRRRFHCGVLFATFLIAAVAVSCANHDRRADVSQNQLITISDIIALNVTGALAFKDNSSVQQTLNSIHRTDADSAVVLSKDGSIFSQYQKTNATISPMRLAQFLQSQLPEPRSAYSTEIAAFVAVSPVKSAGDTIGYVALALK
jgi:hypothetical protein